MTEKIKWIALIYCRVSSLRQVNEGHGNESQEKRCRDFATNKGYIVEKVFIDDGVSGSLFDRPAMQAILEYIDAHPNKNFVVIFDDLSRFARDVAVHIRLRAEFTSRGVKLECLNFNFDDSEESEYAELVLAAGNQYLRKANRRQVIQKMKARLEKSYWPFMLPITLVNVKDPVHGKIAVPNEPHASIYKPTLEKFAEGILLTPDEVRQELHKEYEKRGLPNRPPLSTVQKALRSPLNAGYVEYAPWGIPFMKAPHEGFISLQTHLKIKERLKKRSKPWQRRDYSSDFPLRPWIICDGCGKPMTASWNKGRSAKYPNYFCRTKGCIYNWKVVSKYKIEAEFEELLLKVKPLEEYVDLMKDILKEQWDLRLEQYTSFRARKKSEFNEASQELEWYIKRVPKVDEELATTYESKIKELRKKVLILEQNLNTESYNSEQFGTASEKVLNTLKEPMSMWKSESYNDKKIVLLMYFEEPLRYDYKSGFGTVSLAYPVKLINEIGQAKNGSVEMSGSEPECKENYLKTSTSLVNFYQFHFILFQLTGRIKQRLNKFNKRANHLNY